MSFSNLIVIITGAANGIGKKIAETLYHKGSKIVVADIQSTVLHNLYDHWDSKRVLICPLDVTQSSAWEQLKDETLQKFGKIDVLLNIAGIIEPGFIHETSIQKIDRQIDINLKGTIYGVHTISQVMVKQKSGHIINISSMAGLAPIPGLNIYTASKFGVRGFSLAVAQELAEHQVKVSVICPDAVKTNMLDYQKDKKEAAMTFSGSRYLEVEELSQAILQLIERPKFEIWLPKSRGVLASVGALFPKVATKIKNGLIQKGIKKQQQYH